MSNAVALNAWLRLHTGHGPFRQALFRNEYGNDEQNGYSNGKDTCKCIWVCEHCDVAFVICDRHGAPGKLKALRDPNRLWSNGHQRAGELMKTLPPSWGMS